MQTIIKIYSVLVDIISQYQYLNAGHLCEFILHLDMNLFIFEIFRHIYHHHGVFGLALVYFNIIKVNNKMSQEQKVQTLRKISQPYSTINQFLNKYKPFTKQLDINKLKINKIIRFVQDQNHGYYYGEINAKGKNGTGVLFYYNGNIYEGSWISNHRNGNGFHKSRYGQTYQGGFKNDKFQGKGSINFLNGDTYNGEWLKGEKSGSGIWKSSKGFHYAGQWKNDDMHGYGVMTESNGDKYQGIFKCGKKNGKGVLKYGNGDIYKGYFLDGQSNGFGEYYWKNGNSYRGEYKKGRRQGPGQLKQKFPLQKTYQGYFKDNMKQGYGVCSWNSGSCYKGFFEKDRFHGYGEMFWPDGNIYRGWWNNNVQNGKGQLYVQGEGLMKGIFNNNRLVLLTQKKLISRKQYQNSLIKNPQKSGPKKNPTFIQKNKRKPILSQHRRIKSDTLDKIQFPLLFHHHSRLKTQQIDIQLYQQKKINKNSERKRYRTLQFEDKQKNLHSALSVHKNFLESNKNTDSTKVSAKNKILLPFWNQKLNTRIKDRRLQKIFGF